MKYTIELKDPRAPESQMEVDAIVRALRNSGAIGHQSIGTKGTVFTYRGGPKMAVEVLIADDAPTVNPWDEPA